MGWFNKKELAEIARLNGIIKKLEMEKNELYTQFEKIPDELYKIRNYDSNIRQLYRTKFKFFSINESKIFEILVSLITAEKELEGKNYFVFPKVRLADIVENWPDVESWDILKDSDKKIAGEIKKTYPLMDDNKYKKLITYPILPLHVDFLICKNNNNMFTPVLAIELDGSEHYDTGYRGKYNDKLKSLIFNNIGNVKLWRIKHKEMGNPDFAEQFKKELINKIEAFEISSAKVNKSDKSAKYIENPLKTFTLMVALFCGIMTVGCGDNGNPGGGGGGGGRGTPGTPLIVDGQTYRTVMMPDGLTWMAENLNRITANSWCYDNKESNCAKYGRLYTWNAAVLACPEDWRLPSNYDWEDLVSAVGSSAGTKGTDVFGFPALFGGLRHANGDFAYADSGGHWWTATRDASTGGAYARSMGPISPGVSENYIGDRNSTGLSVRCVKNN